MQNKFSGTFDVFERERTGLPAARYDVLLPAEAGYGFPNENLNVDAIRGLEGALTYRNSTAAGSALPRVSARSISGKPDLATAAAATSLVS